MDRAEAVEILTYVRDAWASWVPENGSPTHKKLQAIEVAIAALRELLEGEVKDAH